MSDYYAPTITLDGKVLEIRHPIDDLTPLATLEMSWGCDDWLSDVEPGKLTLKILDPDGELLHLVGDPQSIPITVSRVDGILWRGVLDDAEAELIKLPQPGDPTAKRHVWRVLLTATDALGELAADRKHGPPPNSVSTAPRGQTHWGPDSMYGRREALSFRVTPPILFSRPSGFGDEETTWSIDGKYAPLAGYERQQNVSVLSVLHRTMRAVNALNRPYYLHSEGVIVETGPPNLSGATGVTCTYVDGIIDLAAYGDGDTAAVATLDGGHFRINDGVQLAADPSSRITTVERTGRREKIDQDTNGQPILTYEDVTQQITTGAKQREICTASFETDLSPVWWPTIAPMEDWARPAWWADVHQKTAPGTLTYRLPVSDGPKPGALLQLARPEPQLKKFEKNDPTTPAYFRFHTLYGYSLVRSLTNLLPSCREFSILGGTLRYSAKTGWQHDLITAPAGVTAPLTPAPKLGDVTNPAKIGNARPGIRLADLARLTHL